MCSAIPKNGVQLGGTGVRTIETNKANDQPVQIVTTQLNQGALVVRCFMNLVPPHLGVGGGKVMASAPGDIGRGAKAAAHDIKEGHPIAAGKAMGKGIGRAGKAVGEGTESGVKGAKHKVVGKKSDESNPPPKQ
jgi:hypothetical protein